MTDYDKSGDFYSCKHEMDMDILSWISLAFFLCTLSSFGIIYVSQYRKLNGDTNRLVILITRLALTLPVYAFLVFISVIVPVVFSAVEMVVAIVLGYSFYAFFALMVTNMGGPEQTLAILNASKHKLLCYFCFPSNKEKFYKTVVGSIRALVTTRLIIMLASTVLYYVGTPETTMAATILEVIAVAQLIRGVVSISNLYYAVFDHNRNIHGLMKLILLKLAALLIALQALIAQLLYRFGHNPAAGTSARYSRHDTITRNFCALILLEYTVLSVLFVHSFTRQVTMPGPEYVVYTERHGGMGRSRSPQQPQQKPTVWWFTKQVLNFPDVCGVIALSKREVEEEDRVDVESGTEIRMLSKAC